MTPSPIGVRLKELREAAGLSQAELAQRTGLNQPSISDIETGVTKHPRRLTISQLERALGGELMGRPREPQSASLDEAIELLSIYQMLPRDARVALMSTARGLQSAHDGLSIDV